MKVRRNGWVRLLLLSVAVFVVGGLSACHQATSTPASSSSQQASTKSKPAQKAASTSSKTQTPPAPIDNSGRTDKVLAAGQVAQTTPGSNAQLVQVIAKSMSQLAPSDHGPARWSVAVASATGSLHAGASNWLPANSQFSASTIKLFVLIRYFELVKAGRLNPTSTYTLVKRDVVAGSGKLYHRPLGTKLTLNQLCTLMITQSDNIATNVLIDKVGGFGAVNATIAQVVGPNHKSVLQRKMMDLRNIKNGLANRINATEAATTLVKVYQGKIIDRTYSNKILSLMATTENRHKLPARLPAGATCWNKSGESAYRGIENDMALIRYRGKVFAIVALTELDGNPDQPRTSTETQDTSQIATLAGLGANVTAFMAQH